MKISNQVFGQWLKKFALPGLIIAICVVAISVVWFTSLLAFPASTATMDVALPSSFNENWQLHTAQGLQPITVPGYVVIGHNEALTITNTLPKFSKQTSSLLFFSSMQAIRVLVDKQEIYLFGQHYNNNSFCDSPSRWNLIPLPADCGGKTITVTIKADTSLYNGSISGFYLGAPNQNRYFAMEASLPFLVMAVLIFLVGVFFLVACLCLWLLVDKKNRAHYGNIFYLGLFAILAGLRIFFGNGLDLFILDRPDLAWMILLTTQFLLPIPLLLFIKCRAENPNHQQFIFALVLISVGTTALCFILHFFGMVNLATTMDVSWLLIFIAIIANGIITIYQWPQFNESEQKLARVGLGLVGLDFAAIIYLFLTHQLVALDFLLQITVLLFCIYCGISAMLLLIKLHNQEEVMAVELENQRLITLVNQVKPHFIYNTLGAISSKIDSNPDLAKQTINDFAVYLRNNIDGMTSSSLVPFSKELENIRLYLNIEAMRFSGKFQVEYEIRADDFEIPPLTVQTLVENAVKYGLSTQKSEGHLWIAAWETATAYFVQVVDNGTGFSGDCSLNSGAASTAFHGIKSVRIRLASLLDGKLTLKNLEGGGCLAEICIPKKEELSNEDDFC